MQLGWRTCQYTQLTHRPLAQQIPVRPPKHQTWPIQRPQGKLKMCPSKRKHHQEQQLPQPKPNFLLQKKKCKPEHQPNNFRKNDFFSWYSCKIQYASMCIINNARDWLDSGEWDISFSFFATCILRNLLCGSHIGFFLYGCLLLFYHMMVVYNISCVSIIY